MKEDMQQTSDIALKVTNVSKSFKLPTEKSSSLKNSLFNLIRGVHGYTIQEVLKDISFEVHKGDFFGIVGQNGSGKIDVAEKLFRKSIRRIPVAFRLKASLSPSLSLALVSTLS